MAQPWTNDSLLNARKLDDAISAYASGKMDKSIEILEEIIADTSDSSLTRRNTLWYLGVCHSALGNHETARWAIAEMIRSYPKFAPNPDAFPSAALELYYEVKREIHGNLLIEQPDPGVQTMAVADFVNRSITAEKETYVPLEKGFADFMIHALSDTTALRIVERDRFQWVLREHATQDSLAKDRAVRTGKLLGVHVVLMGSFMVLKDDELVLSARLVKVETGEILFAERHQGKFEDFIEIIDELGERIAEEIITKEIYQPQASAPKTLDAMMAYSRGVDYLDQKMYDKAYEMLKRSLEYDPNYKKSQQQMTRIWPLVAMQNNKRH